MNPTWRKRFAFAGRVAAGTVLLLVALELALRPFGYGSYVLYAPDEDVLWHPVPDQRGRTVKNRLPITINNLGFRYPVDLARRDPGEVRILAFGDSVTMGWGVDDDSHYSAVLERRFEAHPPGPRPVRVVSAGVTAYPISLCVRRFQKLLDEGTQIDLAILAYSFNHTHERLARLRGAEREAFLRKVRLKGLVRRSALYNLVIEDLLRQAVYYRIRARLLEGSWSHTPPAGAQLGEDLSAYRGELEAMKAAGDRHGVALVFLLFGSQGQRSNLDGFQTAFLEFAHQRQIPVVDMVTLLAAEDHAPLFMDHTHPSVAGHARIAAALHELVESRGLAGAPAAVPRGGEQPAAEEIR